MPLRPLLFSEILDGAFQAIRSNPRTMLGISATLISVVTVLGMLPQFYLLTTLRRFGDPETVSEDAFIDLLPGLAGAVGGIGLATLLKVLASSILSALLVAAVSEAVIGRRSSPGQVWRRVRPRLLGVVGVALAAVLLPLLVSAVLIGVTIALTVAAESAGVGLGVTVGLLGGLATIALTALIYVRLALAGPALLLEGIGVGAALRRSWQLISGAWWRTFGMLLATSILVAIAAGLISAPTSQLSNWLALSGDLSATEPGRVALATVIGGLGEVVSGVVMTPFAAAVTCLLYIDRRMRREGLDIDLIRAAAEPPSTAG